MVAPWFVIEEVHLAFAHYAEAMAKGNIDRLMIEAPPRGSKTFTWGVLFPSWWVGKFPSDFVMQVGYKSDLPKDSSRDVLNIMRTEHYSWAFPGVGVARDSRAVGRWRVEELSLGRDGMPGVNARQGQYHAAGVTAGIAGTGFNLGLVDDPLSEQDKDSKLAKDRVWNWYGPGFYTRRQPERNAIVVISTRWAKDDLVGRLRELGDHGGDKWEILSVPAILDGSAAKKIYTLASNYKGNVESLIKVRPLKAGDSYSPRRWAKDKLLRSKANMSSRDWQALFLQKPTEDEGHIIRREWWRLWPNREPPECSFIFQMYDTAIEKGEQNDFSARTSWGVFEAREAGEPTGRFNMIMLDRWKERVEFPELCTEIEESAIGNPKTKREGMKPDRILIEAKQSGAPAVQALKRRRNPPLPVEKFNLPRGTQKELGKYARAQLAALVFEQGGVWYMGREWAKEVIEECAACKFDGSDEHDDIPDTVVNAAIWVRKTYRVDLPTDEESEEAQRLSQPKRVRQLYG